MRKYQVRYRRTIGPIEGLCTTIVMIGFIIASFVMYFHNMR